MANRQNLKCTDPGTFSSFKGLKLGHYNIRSMTTQKKFEYITDLVNLFDIFCVSESWLTKDYPDNKILIRDHKAFRSDRLTDKVGGGLVIYTHDSLSPYCSIESRLNVSDANVELMVLNYTEDKHRLMTIILVYHPPSGNYVKCLEKLVETCQDDQLVGRKLWVIGDININLFDLQSPETKGYLKTMHDLNLLDKINLITRPHTKSLGGTCIDIIATGCDVVLHSGTLPVYVSDHLPIYAVRKKAKSSPINITVMGRSYRTYDQSDFFDFLLNYDWSIFNVSTNVDEKWCHLIDVIMAYLDIHCPLREMKFKDHKKPWMTKEIFELIFQRNETMLQYCREGKSNDVLLLQGKMLRDRINVMSKFAQDNYMVEKLETLADNPTKFWRELNTLLGRSNDIKPEITLKHHTTGQDIRGDKVAGYINQYFSEVGNLLFEGLGSAPRVSKDIRPSCASHPVTPDTMIMCGEVLALVKKIETHKSSGIDNISALVLKDALIILAPQLTAIINLSLHSIKFPSAWATAKVVPLPKSGDLSHIGNWRPISLLPAPSKVMERIIYSRIYSHLEENHKLSQCQFGFRASRGTGDAVFTLLNDLFRARDSGEVVAACFLDVRKAFDSINHSELITRMRALDIPSIYSDWLCAYLADRGQRVICNNHTSGPRRITYGVPQGSILGPLLFICYVNNLPNVVKNCCMIMYADDVIFYTSHKNIDTTEKLLQADASNVYDWFCKSGLCINTEKTKVMTFSRAKPANRPKLSISMGDVTLGLCSDYEYLGVILDGQLNLNKMASKTVSSASHRLYMFAKLRNKMSKRVACTVYKQTISPVLEYCGFIYNGATETIQKRIQHVQNRCLRICLKVKIRYGVLKLHADTSTDFIGVRHDLQLLLLLHKFIYSGKHDPSDFGICLKPGTAGGRITRSSNTAEIVYPTSINRGFRKCPLYRGVDLWNQMDPACRLNSCKEGFKRLAKIKLTKLYMARWYAHVPLPLGENT